MARTWWLTPEQIRVLPTPELAVGLLRKLNGDINANSTFRTAEHAFDGEADLPHLLDRLADAWAWLESNALIGPNPRQTAVEHRRMTDAGRAVAASDYGLARIQADRRLAGPLDPTLEASARAIYNFGEHESAVVAALKAVEVEVRQASGLTTDAFGKSLMEQAFAPGAGPLADPDTHRTEQTAVMQLFTGAIGAFRNPASHRSVELDDPVEVAEVIQLANLLLRIVRRAERRRHTSTTGGS